MHIYMCVCVCVRVRVRVLKRVCVYMEGWMCTYVYIMFVHVSICMYICSCMNVIMRVCLFVCMCGRVYVQN